MPGGKGKSIGGKNAPKDAAGKTQKSHSAKAGLQVGDPISPNLCRLPLHIFQLGLCCACTLTTTNALPST